jgi:hypothetical protein
VAAPIVPPDGALAIVQVQPVPLPPEAVKVTAPPCATSASAGATTTLGPTAIDAVASLPSESVTRTTSVTPPVAPAV